MRLPPGEFLRRWQSGEVYRLAAQVRSAAELAEKLGLSPDALVSQMQRLRRAGHDIPTLTEIIQFAHGSGMWGAGSNVPLPTEDDDPWGEDEKTSPDLSSVIYPESRYPLGSEVDGDWRVTGQEQAGIPPDSQLKFRGVEQKVPGPRGRVEELEPVEEHQLKRKVADLKSDNKRLLETVASLREQNEIVEAALCHRVAPIVPRERKSGLREGTPVFLVSDLHLEERVVPAKVQGLNCFTLDIARHRMRRLAEGIRWFIDSQRQDFLIRDVCLWIGGDTFTGHLHPDNVESTQLAPPAAFAFSKQLIEDVIDNTLADPLIERLVIPMNDGNHSRLTKELRAATRVEHSLEWLMYALIAEKYRGNPRVQFEIAQGDHLYTQIHELTVRWTHGAEINYGGGIGGMTIPINKAIAQFQTHRRADLTCLGHFHTRLSLRHIEANSSLIGFSPYALRIKAAYEEPTQSAFMIDSKRGKSVSAPIWVSDDEERVLWAA